MPYSGTTTKFRPMFTAEAITKKTGIMRFFLATFEPTQKTKYTA